MSRLLIPNTTQVPNVLIDVVMRQVSDPALRVLLAIVRKTYGFQKQSDHISLTQLEMITGLSRQGAVNGVKALGQIISVRQGKREGNEYALNLNVGTGELVNGVDQSTGCTSQRDTVFTSQRGRHTKPIRTKPIRHGAKAPESFSIAKQRKLTRPAPAMLAAFEQFYQAYPKHVGKAEALKAWTTLAPNAETITQIMAGVRRYVESVDGTDPKYIKHPGPWLNTRRWEDEPLSNGHDKPKQVKDLGDGFVEVDGRRMDRQTAERRYGQVAN